MSRVIQGVASVQFQLNARKANASMRALQEESKKLNTELAQIKQKLDNPGQFKLNDSQIETYQKRVRELTTDLKNLEKTTKELTKGATAADELLARAASGNMEQLTIRQLKAGKNALSKRAENFQTGDAEDQKRYRVMQEVIQEADRLILKFQSDAQHVTDTIQKGGTVSKQVMTQTKNALLQLRDSEVKGSQEWLNYDQQLKLVEAELVKVADAEKKAAAANQGKLMADRMKHLKTLSADALAETRKYWEQMISGAEHGSKELVRYENQLKKVVNQERARRVSAANTVITNPTRHGVAEIRNSVAEMEKLRDSVAKGSRAWTQYNKLVEQGKSYLNQLAQNEAAQRVNQQMQHLNTLSTQGLAEVRKYWEQMAAGAARGSKELKTYEANLQKVVAQEQKRRVSGLSNILNNPSKHGISEVKNAVTEMEKLRDSVKHGGTEWQNYNRLVEQGRNYLDRLAKNEAAARINQQMQNLTTLSAQGLAEVKKYWETMVAGAAKGSKELATYEARLQKVIAEEQKRRVAGLSNVLTNPSRHGVAEVKNAVAEMEKLRDSTAKGSAAWKQYNTLLEQGRTYLNQLAQNEAAQRIASQMKNLSTLSAQGIAEVRKYWETMVSGAAHGSTELKTYEAELQKIIAEEQKRKTAAQQQKVGILSGNLANRSEAEIRAAIEAAKQLIQTYETASPQAQRLAQNIVNAEEHLKKFGLDAVRAANKQKQSIIDMETQLARGTGLTTETLKAQEQFWQRLINNPKAAANELARYFDNLNKVRAAMKEQAEGKVKAQGLSALQRFRGDINYENRVSAEQLKADADALRKYRDSLPKEGNLSLIREIDYYLGLTGKTAQGAAQQVMSLADAEALAGKLGTKGFTASTTQLQQAKKALIDAQNAAGRGTARFTQLQEAINKVDLELKRTGELSKQVDATLNSPKGKSLNELKLAVEEGRKRLASMSRETKQGQKAFDELAKKIKACDLELKTLTGTSKGAASAFGKAWSRLKTYIGIYVGAAVAMQKIIGTLGDIMTLSDKMGEVRKTTDMSAEAVARLTERLKDLDTRTSLTDLVSMAARGGQLGLKAEEDIIGFTEAANKLMVALPEMGEDAATSLMKIATATGEVNRNGGDVEETLERVGSTIIALRANSASAAPAITDFVKRVGAVGAQSGISIDQVAALGSTVDALGGRVEMSATALSRMIPAIRNNSFAVAKAIGITEKELKGMTTMEQMVTIFRRLHDSVKDFDTSTDEGMSAMADKVEQIMGKDASMAEVMKTLNQQGARAGIVFGLLSQNVDELEKQLDTASEAYEKNIALQKEYNNMNETTAAKWAKLKNQFEEMFVGPQANDTLGWIIDRLRNLVDLISGNVGPAFKWLSELVQIFIVYWGALKIGLGEAVFLQAGKGLKAMGTNLLNLISNTKQTIVYSRMMSAAQRELKAATDATSIALAKQKIATIETEMAQKGLNKAMIANVWMAVAAAIGFVLLQLYGYIKRTREAAKATDVLAEAEANAREESTKELAKLRQLYDATKDQTKSIEERKKALHDMVGDEKYNKYYKNLSTESELAQAAASAYKELSEQIIATARARALDATAQKLQEERIRLENENSDLQKRNRENEGKYRAEKAKADRAVAEEGTAQANMGGVGGSRIGYVRASNAGDKKVIGEYQANERKIGENDKAIEKIDEDLERVKKQVAGLTGTKGDGGGGGGGGGGNSPYGSYDKINSPYSEWNGDDLVARRKEMLERVRALANGADVQAVLSEDAKFITEATRKNIKTTEQAIEWYNAERLKIQEALYAKHLTNTGDWRDEKTGSKSWRKLIENDFDTYLRILDAYYTERKAKIEKAQAEEGLSEAEAQRLTIENETVWRKHRIELQQIYQGKAGQIAAEERQRIYDILAQQDEDSADMVEKTIAKSLEKMKVLEGKSEVEYRKIMSKLVKDIATDFYKQQNAVAKQMEAITAIIAKERPFNGLTKNLQDNLSTMGILFADFDKKRQEAIAAGKEPEDDTAQRAEQDVKRMLLLLQEAENAYSLTFDQLAEKMRKAGLGDWADALMVDEQKQQAVIASLHNFYDQVQDAIKKESSQIKKQVDIVWNDMVDSLSIKGPDGKDIQMSIKGTYERAINQLGLQQQSVSRANSLIGAGAASERVADRLAIKQMEIRLAMQQHYYNLIKQKGADHIKKLEQEADALERQGQIEEANIKRLDVKHAKSALALSDAEEQTKIMEQQNAIANQLEESQNRLYTAMKEWADLFASSLQSVFEASHAGEADYYNELAKLNLTGKGGPGAGIYVVIDNASTSDAEAHYEYLDEREALERQLEIERQNAQAEAWKKVMDDLNQKMSEQITDWINASLQNASINANTQAILANTKAIYDSMNGGGASTDFTGDNIQRNAEGFAVDAQGQVVTPIAPTEPTTDAQPVKPFWQMSDEELAKAQENNATLWNNYAETGIAAMQTMTDATAEMPSVVTHPFPTSQEEVELTTELVTQSAQAQAQAKIDASKAETDVIVSNAQKQQQAQTQTNDQAVKSTKASFAAMTAAANMYGIAYQAMSNENLSTAQRVQMMIVQAAGQAAMTMLTVAMSADTAETAMHAPAWISKTLKELGPIGGPVAVGVFTALIGGLMGLATSKITKSKSEIAQATGASSASAGRLTTGMMTYAEGNVNEFTDPSTLTPGRSYNVDAADGKTYRARYTGSNPRTHIANRPEFHLVGEAGPEAIIDAKTTRQIRMDESGIWHTIQTLSNGGCLPSTRRMRRGAGMRAFADGNLDDFEEVMENADIEGMGSQQSGMSGEQAAALTAALDRQNDLLEHLATYGVKGHFDPYGRGGLVDSYDRAKKELMSHGEKY